MVTTSGEPDGMMWSTGAGSNNPSSSACSSLWSILRFINTFAVAILAVVVTWMFFQLQYVHYTLNQQEDRIDQLIDELQNQQSAQISELTQQVEDNYSLSIYQMAGTFTLLTGLLTMFHMSTHLRNYHEPIVQKKVVTILWMSPIYGTTSFLALILPGADGYLAVIRDFYEAYVIYTFLSLLIAILGRGNRDVVVDVLAQHADHLKPPTPVLKACCLGSAGYHHANPEFGSDANRAKADAVLYECQVLAMQFVFLRPITSIAGFVTFTLMHAHDDEKSNSTEEVDEWSYFKSPGFFIAMVTNVSVFFAFSGLLKFYHAVSEDLAWCQPFSKFMAIKGIVFLTFWQGLAISIFVQLKHENDDASSKSSKTPYEEAAEIQNVLICLEMLFFSIAHWCVFPHEEWEEGYRPKEYAKPSLGLKDFASDVSYIVSGRRRRKNTFEREKGSDHSGSDANTAEEDARFDGLQTASVSSLGGDTANESMSTSRRRSDVELGHPEDDIVMDAPVELPAYHDDASSSSGPHRRMSSPTDSPRGIQ